MADTKISALTAKATVVAGDITNILDSAASNADKKVTMATIKTYTDSDVVKTVNSTTPTAGDVTLDADDIDDTSTTNKFVTAADITVLGNTSGTNTGDQDLSGLQDDVITTRGDVVIGDATGAAARLAVGTSGQVLTTDGTDVSWGAASGGFENPMTTAGDIIYGGVDGAAARLGVGTDGQVLTLASGVPAWAAAAAGGGIGEFNGTEALTVSGANAIGIGTATSSSDRSIAIGASSSDTIASSIGAIAIGAQTSATGSTSLAVGFVASATGQDSVAIGRGANVVNSGASALGYYSAAGANHSTALGSNAETKRYSETVIAIEKSTTPNRQMGIVGYKGDTASNTATEIFLSGVSNQRLTLYDTDQVISFDGKFIAVDYTNNKSAKWTVNGLIERHGGTTALVGTPTVTNDFYSTGMDSCVVAVTADDTNDALAVTVTGLAATTIRWTGRIDFVEDIDR